MNASETFYQGTGGDAVRAVFKAAPFVLDLGIELVDAGKGWVKSRLTLLPRHLQHTGAAHAGVVTTLADHSCGGAVATLVNPDLAVVTVEFKINFLRAARGDALECHAEIVREARNLSVAIADVFALGAGRNHVARLVATLTQVTY